MSNGNSLTHDKFRGQHSTTMLLTVLLRDTLGVGEAGAHVQRAGQQPSFLTL